MPFSPSFFHKHLYTVSLSLHQMDSYKYEDEDYIDMEVKASHSPQKVKDFEFQMALSNGGAQATITSSPADELFYKGNLLPLHLPPRLEMVKSLLQSQLQEEDFITISTPVNEQQACNFSPSESCRVSTEMNPDEFFFQWSTGFVGHHHKKLVHPWPKKVKQSSITQKLKASRNYLKSFFNKSEPKNFWIKGTRKVDDPREENAIKGVEDEGGFGHRKSFSGAIKRKCSPTSSSSSVTSSSCSNASSSSSSFNYSNGSYEFDLCKRNSSANYSELEVEGSIEAAIDHCKRSQDMFASSRNSLSESVFFPLSLS